MRLTFETWIRDQCTTTSEFNIARRAWQACEFALTRERDEALAALNGAKCILGVIPNRDRELALAEAAIAGAYREAANCLRKRQHVVGNVEAILALTPPPLPSVPRNCW